MEQISLKIQMLGDFSVSYNDNVIISESNRNKKVIFLLQYLFMKHGVAIKQEELINKLFGDSNEYEDPVHMLKNIVYRLRIFLVASGLPEREYIFFKKGAYGLCEDIAYDVDVEKFETTVKKAQSKTCDKESCLRFCLDAISLYSGDFLPQSAKDRLI